MEIRPYDPGRGDADATFAVFLRAVRGTSPAHYDAGQVDAWVAADPGRWARARAASSSFVAEADGAVIGVADVDADGLVDVLFVDPAAGRHGVGGALLDAVVAEGERLGLAALHAHVSLTAEPVFRRAGFRDVARRRPVVRGRAFSNLEMLRSLREG